MITFSFGVFQIVTPAADRHTESRYPHRIVVSASEPHNVRVSVVILPSWASSCVDSKTFFCDVFVRALA